MSTVSVPRKENRALSAPAALRTARDQQVLSGTYRLLERIGVGGMAEVYAAEHLRLNRRVAVKLVRADLGPKALARFRREAGSIARIDSEFVVSVLDCGEADDGTPFLVMELLNGEDLRSLLEEVGPLPIARAVHLLLDASHGVAAVHRQSLVHRDLKPENLFVTKRVTGEDWCKILDFGIVKTDTSSTAEGALIGTVKYMAPEQLQDGASAGPSVDIYALGAVLYECLCGEGIHSGTSAQELMFKVIHEEPQRLEGRRREVPVGLADAVHRALAKSPQDRFRDVQEFTRAIAPFTQAGFALQSSATTVAFEDVAQAARAGRWRPRLTLLLAMTASAAVGFALRGAAKAPRIAPALPAPAAVVPSVVATAQAAPAAVPVAPSAAPVAPPTSSAMPATSVPRAGAKRAVSASPSKPHAAPLHALFDAENPYAR